MFKTRDPDSALIKTLSYIKAMLYLAGYLLQRPSVGRWRVAVHILRLKPHYTMLSADRLVNLYERVTDAAATNTPGDIVECGSWQGGSSALMAAAARDTTSERHSWVFDSFEGVPPPTDADGSDEHAVYAEGLNKASADGVRDAFARCNIPPEQYTIVPGWFEDTLVGSDVNQIAVLHIDADWYEPVYYVLQVFYERVVPGGYIIVDDYGYWDGATKALDTYMSAHAPAVPIHTVGTVAAWIHKPLAEPVDEA